MLNADYRPLSVIDIRRAVVLDMNSPNVTALSYYCECIRSISGHVKIPAVMVYSKYVHVVRKKSPSKRAIKMRDGNKCAYCGILLDNDNFTIDHVVPVSRFKNKTKANTWENKVSCCQKCNLKKGNKTPEEANMRMLFKPKKLDMVFIVDQIPQEWKEYM